MRFEAIPGELKKLRQWVNWRYEERGGKQTKVPIRKISSTWIRASTTRPATWVSFEEAEANSSDEIGIGFVFTRGDGFFGIDLDNCMNGLGKPNEFATAIITELESYTEYSVSNTGCHIILQGELPEEWRNRGDGWEVYGWGRYFCFTGCLVPVAGSVFRIIKTADAPIFSFLKNHFNGARLRPRNSDDSGENPQNREVIPTPADDVEISTTTVAEVKKRIEESELVYNAGVGVPDLVLTLLETHAEFKRTWNGNRREFRSPSEYCASIAAILIGYECDPQTIINCMVAWRRIRGATDQTLEWYVRTLDNAERFLRVQRAAESDSDGMTRETAMSTFSTAVGAPVSRVVQSTLVSELITIEFEDGRDCLIGDMGKFLNHRHVDARLRAQVKLSLPLGMTSRLWRQNIDGILPYIEVVNVDAGNAVEVVWSWLADYTSAHPVRLEDSSESMDSVRSQREPYVKDDFFWFALPSLRMHLKNTEGRTSFAGMADALRRAGFTHEAVSIKGSSRSYWKVSVERAKEAGVV